MTEAEKQEIVGLVMTQISSQAVDFDLGSETPKNEDRIVAVRIMEDGTYTGVTLKWADVADTAIGQAVIAKNEAASARDDAVTANTNAQNANTAAQAAMTSAQTAKSEAESAKSAAETAKSNAESAKAAAESASQSASQAATTAAGHASTASSAAESAASDKTASETARQGAEKAMGLAKGYEESAATSAQKAQDNIERFLPIDFRVTDPNRVILDVDVTGTMGAFMDGMEQEPNEAIALTLEPDVPTAGSHNFGVRGQICIDGNYLYVCVADNTWKKIPLQEL